MVAGHYAISLVAYERHREGPLWLFLIAGMFLDILMILLVLVGVEEMAPGPGATRPGFSTMVIDMSYSHDLVPVAGWAVAMTAAAYLVTRNRGAAIWAGGLVLLHEVADLVSGFPHFVLGPDSPAIGLGLYIHAPVGALVAELLVALACVWWFSTRTRLAGRRQLALYLLSFLGVGALLPMAL